MLSHPRCPDNCATFIAQAIVPLFSVTNRPSSRPAWFTAYFSNRGMLSREDKDQVEIQLKRELGVAPLSKAKWREFYFANGHPADYWKPWRRKGAQTTFEYRSAVRDVHSRHNGALSLKGIFWQSTFLCARKWEKRVGRLFVVYPALRSSLSNVRTPWTWREFSL